MTFRRSMLAAAVAAGLALPGVASAQAPTFFRIGTGSAGGTYYPIGGIIANALSCPPGAPCNTAGATDVVTSAACDAHTTDGVAPLADADIAIPQETSTWTAHTGTYTPRDPTTNRA